MKLGNPLLCIFALGVALTIGTAAAQEAQPSENSSPVPASTIAQEPSPSAAGGTAAFRTRKEMVSYAFGLALVADMRRQDLNLDLDLVTKALRDASEGKTQLMSAAEALKALKAFEAERHQDLELAQKMLSDRNKKAADAKFAENVKQDGIVTLPSGLQYKVLKQGNGKKPSLDDKVVCHYRGTLLDGKEFDSSYKRNEPATLPVKGMIKGWTEALQLMAVGSKWQLFIPPHLAYGERGAGRSIEPNATLIFEVELLSIEMQNNAGVEKPGQ
jgi:FKBP-type peptidyl-prolyl cis-trans isomerase